MLGLIGNHRFGSFKFDMLFSMLKFARSNGGFDMGTLREPLGFF